MEAVAKHDFNATADDELSFRRGQTLKNPVYDINRYRLLLHNGTNVRFRRNVHEQQVLNMDEDQNWYRAELDNKEGMIPSNYIKMKDNSWYLGKISRIDAENLLLRQRYEGVFLVRASESTPGDFSLSVKCGDSAQHFKVLRDEQGKYFLWMRRFNSLNELVEYHKTTSVTRNQPDVKLRDPDRPLHEALVIAEYDFTPQEPNEIAFKRGDIIIVVSKQHPHWWEGEIRGKRGLFPNSYVSPYLQQATSK